MEFHCSSPIPLQFLNRIPGHYHLKIHVPEIRSAPISNHRSILEQWDLMGLGLYDSGIDWVSIHPVISTGH